MITNGGDTFCFWDASSNTNCIIIICNMVITLCLTILILVNFYRSEQPKINKFYLCLCLWAIFYFLQGIYGVVQYYKELDGVIESEEAQFITSISTYYMILDTIPAFILQTLLFMIPMHLIKNVMDIISSYGYFLEDRQKFWYKMLVRYQYLRSIIVFPHILLFIFLKLSLGDNQKVQALQYTTIVIVMMVCIDCLVCNVVLYITYKYLNKKYQTLRIDNEEEKRKFKCQCILLSISATGRFAIDLFFIISQIAFLNSEDRYCFESDPTGLRLMYNIVYVMIGVVLMHFVPVCTVLWMYKPK